MEDTACKDCPFKKMGFSECPNYIETLWHVEGNPQPKIVKDCAPKRSLLMIQELHNRNFALQKQISQQEGSIEKCSGDLNKLFEAVRYMEENYLLQANNRKKMLENLESMKKFAATEEFKRIE